MSSAEFHIERLSAQNMVDFYQLYCVVHGKNQSADYFAKKYDTAYTGVSFVGYIAYDDSLPVAFYGVVPCFLTYDNAQILAAQSVDTMTHPGYRQKGLFIALMEKTIALCSQLQIQLLFGFPNQNSHKGFVKANWHVAEYLDCFTIKTKPAPIIKLVSKYFRFKKLYAWSVAAILKSYQTDKTGLSNSALNDGFDVVLRDEKYFKYKAYSSTRVIKIGQSLIWFKIQNGLTIGDMIVNKEDFDTTISALKKLAGQLGLSQITFQTSNGTRLHQLFSGSYPAAQYFPVIFYPVSPEIVTGNIKFTFADIDIF